MSGGTQWAAGNIGLKLGNENGAEEDRLESGGLEDANDRQGGETAARQAVCLHNEIENMVPALTNQYKIKI